MKKIIIVTLAAAGLIYGPVFAEQTEIMRQVQKKSKPPRVQAEATEKIYAHSLYEYSWIKQGSKKGNWRIFSNRAAYLKDNLQAFYVESTGYGRFGVPDYALDLGSYLKLQNGYVHGEVGFGTDHINYIYRLKTDLEVEHKIINDWFINADTKYLHHTQDGSGDVYIFSPGLVRYFGNSYISGSYGLSFTEHRDSAQYGVFKGGFALNDRINLAAGVALGNRLFDIDTIKSNKQYSSIFFGGLDIATTKNITFRIGGSYSKERPSFIKRSIDFGAKIKF